MQFSARRFAPARELRADDKLHALARWAGLGIRRREMGSCKFGQHALLVEAVVEIAADIRIISAEDVADAVEVIGALLIARHCLIEAAPGAWAIAGGAV